MSLDDFFCGPPKPKVTPVPAPKPKIEPKPEPKKPVIPENAVICAGCGEPILGPIYKLTLKEKKPGDYCRNCAVGKMPKKPKPKPEEIDVPKKKKNESDGRDFE